MTDHKAEYRNEHNDQIRLERFSAASRTEAEEIAKKLRKNGETLIDISIAAPEITVTETSV